MMDKDLNKDEIIRNLSNDLEVVRNLFREYKLVTQNQIALQNVQLASKIKDYEELQIKYKELKGE